MMNCMGMSCGRGWIEVMAEMENPTPITSGLHVIAENTPGVTEVHDQMCWIEPNSGVYLPSGEEGARPNG